MSKKLSILIPSIKRHESYLIKLMMELSRQIRPYDGQVEILVDESEVDSIGEKRNRLLQRAVGTHLCFFDSDDFPSEKYIELLMEAIDSDCDCASLKGIITTDGKNPQVFEHSIKYDAWATNADSAEVKYVRTPNHLSLIRASIAKQFKFPEANFGEDHVWSKEIHQSGLLKKEHYISDVLYYYQFISKK